MSTPDVRVATPEDVAAIVRIQRRTWRVAYTELVGEQALARLESTEIERDWATAIEHPDTVLHLAIEADEVVGYCVAGAAPHEEIAAADGHLPTDVDTVGLIGGLLVEPRWSRRGHGGRLLVAAAGELRARGMQRGVSWVAQSDSASLSFFRGVGWHPDNTVRTLDTGERAVRELRLTGTLGFTLDR